MILSIHFECGLKYDGPTDKETMRKLAERYFAGFIDSHREMEWCDVTIYDKSRHVIGASRNPPSLPHRWRHCETCMFFCESYRVGESTMFCCNPNKDCRWFPVFPEGSCEDWRFDSEYYFKEEEQ